MICRCVFIYDFIYEIIYEIICRYIWAYREQLCRSVHDMSKQRYATKKYGVKAWQALAEWVYQCSDDESNRRQSLLLTFTKDDTDFWDVVAACLWSLATAANLPWGRYAVQPSVYSALPDYEKVAYGRIDTRLFFFFSLSITQTIYGLTYVGFVCPCSYVIQAWAFSCGVRHILNKAPAMWLKDFPHDVWVLHRKLHHRFLKFRKSFRAATDRLPLFQQGIQMTTPATGSTQRPTKHKSTSKHNVICLLSDSPGDSTTTGESDEGEGTQSEDEKDESQEEDGNNDKEGSGDTSLWEDDDEEEEGNQDDEGEGTQEEDEKDESQEEDEKDESQEEDEKDDDQEEDSE